MNSWKAYHYCHKKSLFLTDISAVEQQGKLIGVMWPILLQGKDPVLKLNAGVSTIRHSETCSSSGCILLKVIYPNKNIYTVNTFCIVNIYLYVLLKTLKGNSSFMEKRNGK